jgi:phospholipase C
MSKRSRLTRREALKLGLGVGAMGLTAGLDGCETGPYRCGELPAPAGGGAAGDAARLLAGIDTIVVVMLENRSFDHLFGSLASDPDYPAARTVDGLTGAEQNLDADGVPVPVNLAPAQISTLDPKHDWDSSHRAWNGGRNDGFVLVNGGANQDEVMSYHRRETAPYLYSLCDEYAVCDRWFSSAMGPTWPNRYYLHAATADGHKTNLPMGLTPPPTVWERLAERCIPAGYYSAGRIPWYSVTFPAKSFSGDDPCAPQTFDQFFTDAARGTLPAFSIIDPDFGISDGHPPYDFGLCEAFLGSIHRALAASVHWPRALMVVVFDEHGGFYDHVPPPTVPDPNPDFRTIGFRVPAIVVGPQVRSGAVISTPYDHVSILATLATRFGIRSLGPRMDAAADLSACLDPARVPGATPTARLPPAIQLPAAVIRSAPFRQTSQPEMEALARAGGVPAHHVDPRDDHQRLASWLRRAQELEAVRVIG